MSVERASGESGDGHRPPLQKIVLGTRGSELARMQARMVETALRATSPELRVETRIITTRGDERAGEAPALGDRRAGRKGLFTREIERALEAGEIDVAVHSAKDLPSEINERLVIGAVLPRASVEDVWISKSGGGFESVPAGSVIGTGSIRRQFQVRWRRPDLTTVDLRGNVPTRLRRLGENSWDAIILASAGLERLGLSLPSGEIRFGSRIYFVEKLDSDAFLPAGGQGVIALQVRRDDAVTRNLVAQINHLQTFRCLRAEREFLRLLEGDCDTPVGVLATVTAGTMTLRAQVFEAGKVEPRTARIEGAARSAEQLAESLWEGVHD